MGLTTTYKPCLSGEIPKSTTSHNESPEHKVIIGRAFQMAIHEVTLGQFKAFIIGSGRDDLLSEEFMNYNSHGDQAAVSDVSWNDAIDFIQWLNEKEEKSTYRLPTEAEWEYGARAGTTTAYFWGNEAKLAQDYAWYDENSYASGRQYAHIVGTKALNAWGFYDMSGNVWEWVQDRYNADYYTSSKANDPIGPESGHLRVNRGGGWYIDVKSLRSAKRNYYSAGSRNYDLGFRLVRQIKS